MVWVQDYHLMLLPMLLRCLVTGPELTREFTSNELANITQDIESEDYPLDGRETVKGVKIGFFLHTPFPSSEIYRSVVFCRACPPRKRPWRRDFVNVSSPYLLSFQDPARSP